MAFTVPKTPTQQFEYEKSMETMSGTADMASHSGHLHTDGQNLSASQFGNTVSVAKA